MVGNKGGFTLTAEITVMNKYAIALAADSAVTIETSDGQKIFNTVNKLFMLSKYHPIGIMIYGNAELLNVPWETIIKMYRNKLGNKPFGKLEEYANDFIYFLSNSNNFFIESEQEEYFKDSTYSIFSDIRKDINEEIEKYLRGHKNITHFKMKAIASRIIKKTYNEWKSLKYLETKSDKDEKSILIKYGKFIEEIKNEVFQKLPYSQESAQLLTKLSTFPFVKDRFSTKLSGIVIAGFGEEEFFPGLISYYVDGVIDGKLKYKFEKARTINFDNDATIIPFAQSEMVATFVEGIEPNLFEYLNSLLSELFLKIYPDTLVKTLKLSKKFNEKLKKTGEEILHDLKEGVNDYKEKRNIFPILKVVSILPKDELAAMAESLVNLTSLKRKISMDSETVGGPIDVAVISKGDGFIWIKRKHYFKPELNNLFFKNYLTH